MILLDCASAGRFRALAKRCILGRPRGLAPPVLIEQSAESVILFAVLGEVALSLQLPELAGTAEWIVAPMAFLDEIQSAPKADARIEVSAEGAGRCTWDERGSQREFTWNNLVSESGLWPLPQTLKGVDPSLLTALHECGKSTAKQGVRFALGRVQIQGKAGTIAGTDGHQLLLCSGFRFSFPESLLIPAVPVFGSREFASEADVVVGRTERHVVVAIGPWTVWLTVDPGGRFPDVHTVIPRRPETRLRLDPSDGALIAEALALCSKCDPDSTGVTLDLSARPAVRIKAGESAPIVEICLTHSACSGPAFDVALNPHYLSRAIALGLHNIQAPSASGPVLFGDGRRTYLTTCFVPAKAIPAAMPARAALVPPDRFSSPSGEPQMPTETNGRSRDEPAALDPIDFMAEAEGLRDALGEVARRAARLVVSLRQLQKQRRVLETAWSSLKNLRLGP